MINRLINNNFKLNKEVKKIIDINELNEKYLHKKKILSKFKEILIRCAIHYKRLNISLEQFYKLDLDSIQPFSNKESYTLICAIKDKDINHINKLLKNNYFLVYDFDHFKQTPLHWAAKRNVYQVISLIVSKGANVNAKDNTGRTPLHVAAAYNNLEAVEALVYDLAESSIKDNNGLLPEDLTNDVIIKMILKRVKALHKLNKTMFVKNFESTIKNGLHYFFMNELKINFLEVKAYEYVKS
jgi:ankyrin repeat protein